MRATIFLFLIFYVINSYSQISDFYFESFKDYDGGKRIAYFNLKDLEDIHQEKFLQSELRKDIEVSRFFVYARENGLNRCMIETGVKISEKDVQIKMNKILSEYNRISDSFKDDEWGFFKEIYQIPDDCPIFKYAPVSNENKEQFLEEISVWRENNKEVYDRIKHLKEEIEVLN